ncbi:hypothetical protein HW555_012377 [Spodoptera exigua]|uniref:Mutant cadherin n=1 Tax=Spodoptera exigua TaxID=7107 RepID=A0A835G536_SPOEX|nr:hypothetical protein HW555_012377 [Spodoptera exigua]
MVMFMSMYRKLEATQPYTGEGARVPALLECNPRISNTDAMRCHFVLSDCPAIAMSAELNGTKRHTRYTLYILDELLAYIQNKISIADEASLVQICASTFTSEQIQNSKSLLIESLSSEVRSTVRKGKGKDNRVLYDIIAIFKTTEPDVLPVFVARELEKLPPITFDHLDVSKLLKDLLIVQAEINNIKSTYVTQGELQSWKEECEKKCLSSSAANISSMNTTGGTENGCSNTCGGEENANCSKFASITTNSQNRYPKRVINTVEGTLEKCYKETVTCLKDNGESDASSVPLSTTSNNLSDQLSKNMGQASQSYASIAAQMNDGFTLVKNKNRKCPVYNLLVDDREPNFVHVVVLAFSLELVGAILPLLLYQVSISSCEQHTIVKPPLAWPTCLQWRSSEIFPKCGDGFTKRMIERHPAETQINV